MSRQKEITSQLLAAYGVISRMEVAAAVVLERVARGAGETSWYFCASKDDLAYVVDAFRPGSVVSFYFDDRMKLSTFGDLPRHCIDEIASRDGDCVVGMIKENGIDIDVGFVASSMSLDEDFEVHSTDSMFIYGAFPARDCDGYAAVTFVLPDEDGIFRPHPH